jgi:peptidoglycan hydrolase-like protein with peptidoglycan-binding domain
MNQGPTLKRGSTGEDVKRLQRLLVMIRLLIFTEIDGIFGTTTERAVRSFQSVRGLVQDGIVGPVTWANFPADPGTVPLQRGSQGAAVLALQRGLLKFRGANTPTDPGDLDGIFGSKTESAVRAYQTAQGLTVDGAVGGRTWWAPAGAAGATLASLAELTTLIRV